MEKKRKKCAGLSHLDSEYLVLLIRTKVDNKKLEKLKKWEKMLSLLVFAGYYYFINLSLLILRIAVLLFEIPKNNAEHQN